MEPVTFFIIYVLPQNPGAPSFISWHNTPQHNSVMEPEALPQLFKFEALEPDFSTLPMTALVCIMQHLPQQERVGSRCCHALVCKAWCDAAAAARTTFNLERCYNPHSLILWLQKYGRVVTDIDLRSSPAVLSQLPCPLLRRLAVQQTSLFMVPGSQLATDIMAATQLSRLHLNQVVFKDQAPDLASVLAALPKLQVSFCC
jgi:hypothetical protein